MIALLLLFAVLAAAAWLYLRHKANALLPGHLVYRDTDRHAVTEPITSHRLRLTGKPDYIYKTDTVTVPVEVKRHAAGKWGPRERDVAQLMAYCLLVEDVWGANVTHGVIEYRGGQRFPIPYSQKERARVRALVEDVRRDRRAPDLPRDHQEAWKCRRCGYSETCGQAMT
jgi:CRISPR-associated exonuclease Cas4